jgi:hypothetical protein
LKFDFLYKVNKTCVLFSVKTFSHQGGAEVSLCPIGQNGSDIAVNGFCEFAGGPDIRTGADSDQQAEIPAKKRLLSPLFRDSREHRPPFGRVHL